MIKEDTFEDRLLAELRSHVADRTEVAAGKRFGARRSRLLVGVAAGVALVAGLAVVVPILQGGGSGPAAFAVTAKDDTAVVEVKTVTSAAQAQQLEDRIKSAGVDAEVVFIPAGKHCRPAPRPSYVDPGANAKGGPRSPDAVYQWVLRPAGLKNMTFLMAVSHTGKATVVDVGFARKGTVRPCELVDGPAS